MLIKINEYLKPTKLFDVSWHGVVIDNLDPKKLGRVKVQINGLLEGDKEKLPWCFPRNNTMFGGGNAISSFSVPDIGSSLEIIFPYKDIYTPVYVGYYQTEKTHQSIFDEDYPESYGWIDKVGNTFKINKETKEFLFKHSSGTQIIIKENGDIELIGKNDRTDTYDKNLTLNVTGNLTANVTKTATINVDEDATLNCKKNVVANVDLKTTVNCKDDVDINSDKNIKCNAKMNIDLNADLNLTAYAKVSGIIKSDVKLDLIAPLVHINGGVSPATSAASHDNVIDSIVGKPIDATNTVFLDK